MDFLIFQTPIGRLTIVGDCEFVTNIFFSGEEPSQFKPDTSQTISPVLRRTATQLEEYFDGKRKTFDIPCKPQGGDFYKKVWATMMEKVLFGQTTSYSELAGMVGNPKAARAVGMANNRNPIPIIIPCHRIVGKNGKLTGFRGGLSIKEKLLQLEAQNL